MTKKTKNKDVPEISALEAYLKTDPNFERAIEQCAKSDAAVPEEKDPAQGKIVKAPKPKQ